MLSRILIFLLLQKDGTHSWASHLAWPDLSLLVYMGKEERGYRKKLDYSQTLRNGEKNVTHLLGTASSIFSLFWLTWLLGAACHYHQAPYRSSHSLPRVPYRNWESPCFVHLSAALALSHLHSTARQQGEFLG